MSDHDILMYFSTLNPNQTSKNSYTLKLTCRVSIITEKSMNEHFAILDFSFFIVKDSIKSELTHPRRGWYARYTPMPLRRQLDAVKIPEYLPTRWVKPTICQSGQKNMFKIKLFSIFLRNGHSSISRTAKKYSRNFQLPSDVLWCSSATLTKEKSLNNFEFS